tara:strand:+ start:4714 stop:4899 length:186 start_codon:yes stop_codon:yes gene_type:complete
MEAITKAFNKFTKVVNNENVYIPRPGVTDENRKTWFDNYDQRKMDRLRAIRNSQIEIKPIT